MAELSVTVVSRNRQESLMRLLESIERQDYPPSEREIIVVDDSSYQPYRIRRPGLRVLRNSTRQYAPASRNRAIDACTGRYILMADDDVELKSTDFLRRGIDILERMPEVALVTPQKTDRREQDGKTVETDFSCSTPSWHSGLLMRRPCVRGYVDYGSMTYLARADVLKETPYDTRFGMGRGHSFCEESDVHARIRRAGHRIYLEPTMRITHHISASGGQDTGTRLYWFAHNHVLFLRKHIPAWRLRALGHVADIVGYSMKYGPGNLPSMLRGWREGWRTELS